MQKTWKIQKYTSVTSTNDLAKETAEDNVVIVADMQTAGRGRRANKWISQDGNLFFSQVLTAQTTVSNLAFVSSLSLAEAIYHFDNKIDITIKWPNDILINKRKVAGILIENTPKNKVVIGIGVNLLSNPSGDETSYLSANLQAEGLKLSKEQLLETYLKFFDINYADCLRDFGLIRAKWLKFASYINQKIKVKRQNRIDEGIFKGIDEQGLLLLEQKDKITAIAVAEVFL